jgi:heat shock protein beta
VENKRKGQKQIFYMADSGKSAEQIKRSVFVEKLDARGYEVLLFTEPLDEVLANTMRNHKYVRLLCDQEYRSTPPLENSHSRTWLKPV